jgi:uncharacterized protein (DUF362 family)
VADKTVAVKVNMTGNPKDKVLDVEAGRTFQVHPNMALALAILLDKAAAKRVRFLESTGQTDPFEKYLDGAGWDLKRLSALKTKIEFEDTRNLGNGKKYVEVKVPWGGNLYPAYHLNHSYVDCDCYISLAKLKNHFEAGVTLSIKNSFGITPPSIYGQHEHDENSKKNRVDMFHLGVEKPADGIPQELDPTTPRRRSYRVPRYTVDTLGIRPIDLGIIDGIETMSCGEGPWNQDLKLQKPGVLLAGRNAVCLDSIATSLMGYDPMAKPATGPFPGDNHIAIAADLGLGTNDPKRIEVVGVALKDALHPFGWEPPARNS